MNRVNLARYKAKFDHILVYLTMVKIDKTPCNIKLYLNINFSKVVKY